MGVEVFLLFCCIYTQKRQVAGRTWNMTALHHRLLHHLLALSVSDYPEVGWKTNYLFNYLSDIHFAVQTVYTLTLGSTKGPSISL